MATDKVKIIPLRHMKIDGQMCDQGVEVSTSRKNGEYLVRMGRCKWAETAQAPAGETVGDTKKG